jgi:hypothetical protein
MKAADIIKKKGADKDSKVGNKLMDWIGKRRSKASKTDNQEKGDE